MKKIDKQHKLDMILKECETLRNLMSVKGNHRLQLISIMSSIHLIGFGYAIENNVGDLLFLMPLFTTPLFFLYVYEYIEEGIMRKYIKQEIEDKKCNGYMSWETYWFEAKCVIKEEREKVKKIAWKYTQIPIWWIAAISFGPAFLYFLLFLLSILSKYFFFLPKYEIIFLFPSIIYIGIVILYVRLLIYVQHTIVNYTMYFVFKDLGFSRRKNKTFTQHIFFVWNKFKKRKR